VTQEPLHEADLVARLCQGDNEALVRLYDQFSGLVYGIALRVLRNRTAAEDVVQEVFLQLWRRPASFDAQRGRLGPWLAVIARHKAIDALRKEKFEVDPEENSAPQRAPGPAPAHFSADCDKAKQLMAQLPHQQREDLELAFLDGLTHVEIAERTGEPLGTIKSRIRLGLMFLRKELTV
jgi:RNA polymerase sigma-70 factor, ECF subfamily